VRALERAGRPYRIAYSAQTHAGTLTPVLAGLAVTVSPITRLPEGLRVLPQGEGLPELPQTRILLLKAQAPRQPLTDALAAHIIDTFRGELRRG
jgi:hypothetical protein